MADEPNNTYGLVVLDCPTLATLSSSHNVQGTQPTFLYAAQFSSAADGGRYIAAGGSGANETKIFDHIANNQLVGTITGLSRGVFTLDFSPAKEVKKLALAGGDASIRIIDIIEEKATADLH